MYIPQRFQRPLTNPRDRRRRHGQIDDGRGLDAAMAAVEHAST